MPENVTPERKRILRAFGAEIVFTDPMEGSDGAIIRAKALYAAEPGSVLLSGSVQQPRQLAGALRHDGAGDHRADRRPPDAFRRRPRHERHVRRRRPAAARVQPSIRLISVQPDSPLHGLEGLKHMATAIVPGIYDPALADEDIGVSTEEAYELTRRLARGRTVRRHLERREPGGRAARRAQTRRTR